MIRPLSLVLVLALASVAATAQPHPIEVDPLAGVLAERLGETETAACIAAGVVREKSTISFGCSKDAGPIALDRDSLFEIGSITKGLTGLLLADMVRKGEVKLEDPVSMHSRPGAKLPNRGGREITLRDLVTHTSGLPRLPPGFAPKDGRNPYKDFDADALYESLARTELERDIGLSHSYSNFGFMWLSEMLARRAGKPFEVLLTERVLVPLGMATASVTIPEERRKRVVIGHDGRYQPVSQWDLSPELSGVGGVRASIGDMTKLAEALAGSRATPMDETIALALTPLHRLGDLESHIGYAWMMRDRGAGRIYTHSGGTGGFRADLYFDRGAKTAAVVLSDSVAQFGDLARHLVDPGMPLLKKRMALALDAEMRKQYLGAYELRPGFILTVFEQGERLMSQATGQGPIEIFRDGTDRFFTRVVDAQLAFNRGADGVIEGLTLHQGGRQVPAKRLK